MKAPNPSQLVGRIWVGLSPRYVALQVTIMLLKPLIKSSGIIDIKIKRSITRSMVTKRGHILTIRVLKKQKMTKE